MAFDGNNIWVTCPGNSTITKVLAATGAIVGTYSAGVPSPQFLAFDGTYIWLTSNGASIVKLLAETCPFRWRA